MCKIALVLASLVCVGHGRRLPSSTRHFQRQAAADIQSLQWFPELTQSRKQGGLLNSLKALAVFLLALNEPAFNPSGAVMPSILGSHASVNMRPMASIIQIKIKVGSLCKNNAETHTGLELRSRAKTFMEESSTPVEPGSVAFVLLAGGSGKRMGAKMPKQYLLLKGREIALWSLDIISAMEEVGEVVVVCDPSYQDVFTGAVDKGYTHGKRLLFAPPGKERMDSVENGLNAVENGKLVCIHDSARPLVRVEDVRQCFVDAAKYGAAVLGVPCKATVKQAQPVGEDGVVKVAQTLDRSTLWEMHTPQVIEPSMLKRGYNHVREAGAEVTDDVSIVEAIGEPVVITEDSYENLKITTPDDLVAAEGILDARQE